MTKKDKKLKSGEEKVVKENNNDKEKENEEEEEDSEVEDPEEEVLPAGGGGDGGQGGGGLEEFASADLVKNPPLGTDEEWQKRMEALKEENKLLRESYITREQMALNASRLIGAHYPTDLSSESQKAYSSNYSYPAGSPYSFIKPEFRGGVHAPEGARDQGRGRGRGSPTAPPPSSPAGASAGSPSGSSASRPSSTRPTPSSPSTPQNSEKTMNFNIDPSNFYRLFEFSNEVELLSQELVGFGMMDSKQYAMLFMKAVEGLSKSEKLIVMMLAVAVKSKQRIEKNLEKFNSQRWYPAVKNFFQTKTVQYTSELKMAINRNKFAVVHIPSCMPSLAAFCFVKMGRATTVESFLENQWAAQLNLSQDLMSIQLEWEKDLWTNRIKKGGKAFEANGFNKSYWDTKSSDTYPLIDLDNMQVIKLSIIDRETLENYLGL